MNTLSYYKQLFSKKNLYFVASFGVLVVSTIMLLLLLKGQTADNLQAKIFSESSKEVSLQVVEKQREVEDLKADLISLPDSDLVIDPEEDIAEVTRYLDDVFANFPGEFVNTSLAFSDLREGEGLAYTEVNLNITSTRDNFFNFLEFVENTGFTSDGQARLMEVRSINISLSSSGEEDTLSYRVVMRIYFQTQTAEEDIEAEAQETNNPFGNLF